MYASYGPPFFRIIPTYRVLSHYDNLYMLYLLLKVCIIVFMIDGMKPDNGVGIFKLCSIVLISDGRVVDTPHLWSKSVHYQKQMHSFALRSSSR